MYRPSVKLNEILEAQKKAKEEGHQHNLNEQFKRLIVLNRIINSINANSNNTQVPGNFQLLINPPTATNGAIIQTIQQGTGFKSRLNSTRFWWLCLYWK